MTIRVNTAQPEKRLVPKAEEIRRKREGIWDPATMISETTAEGAALMAAKANAGGSIPRPDKSINAADERAFSAADEPQNDQMRAGRDFASGGQSFNQARKDAWKTAHQEDLLALAPNGNLDSQANANESPKTESQTARWRKSLD